LTSGAAIDVLTDVASAGVIVYAFVNNDVEGWLCNSSQMFDLQAELVTPMAMSITSVLFGILGFIASLWLLWRRIPVANEDAPWQGRWAVALSRFDRDSSTQLLCRGGSWKLLHTLQLVTLVGEDLLQIAAAVALAIGASIPTSTVGQIAYLCSCLAVAKTSSLYLSLCLPCMCRCRCASTRRIVIGRAVCLFVCTVLIFLVAVLFSVVLITVFKSDVVALSLVSAQLSVRSGLATLAATTAHSGALLVPLSFSRAALAYSNGSLLAEARNAPLPDVAGVWIVTAFFDEDPGYEKLLISATFNMCNVSLLQAGLAPERNGSTAAPAPQGFQSGRLSVTLPATNFKCAYVPGAASGPCVVRTSEEGELPCSSVLALAASCSFAASLAKSCVDANSSVPLAVDANLEFDAPIDGCL
jgi:hypothetical protein